jgi:hypothetical protein
MISTLVVLSFLLALVPSVTAWGKIGHEMVANIAWSRLSNNTQAWFSAVLDIHDAHAGSPLADVADWADIVRFTQFYHWSTPLHYVDVQDDQIEGGCPVIDPGERTKCHFNYARDCDKDVCAAGAIANYSTRLANQASASNSSLKFLTHFVGDIHQPLHSSRKTDKGGNTIHVTFDLAPPKTMLADRKGLYKTKGWNLHSVWDDGIIEKAMRDLYHGKREIFEQNLLEMMKEYAATGQLELWMECADGRKKACTTVWAEESLDFALSWAYRDFDGKEIQDGGSISNEYYRSRLQIVNQRIAAAGVRLAMTLELVFAEIQDHLTRSNFRPGEKIVLKSS